MSTRSRLIRCAVLVVLLCAAASIGPAARYSSAAIAKPNLVLIVTDDQMIDSFPRAMPFLGSRPGGHWIEFSDAVVNVANCCPSRATMLSGQYSHHTDVETNTDGNKFDDGKTVATWLDSAGYETALVGKYLNHYPWDEPENYIPPGWDRWVALSPNATAPDSTSYVLNEDGQLITYDRTKARHYTTDVFSRKANSFIASAREPFFLYLATTAPHYPFAPAPRHASAFVDLAPTPRSFNEADVSDKPAWVRELPLITDAEVSQISEERRSAYRSLLAVDEAVRGVYDALEARGLLENTVLVFMSDNGLAMGEHRWVRRKTCPYENCIRVPLVVRHPWSAGRTVESVVSNADLAPTLVEIAGARATLPLDGRSLVPLLEGSAPDWPDGVLIHKGRSTGGGFTPRWSEGEGPGSTGGPGSFWGVRTGNWKYIEYRTGERELYDLLNDPYELRNVAGRTRYAAVQQELADKLRALKAGT